MWNGPIECRMFRFDMIKGSLKRVSGDGTSNPAGTTGTDTSGTSAP
jgi:putative N6-adenine-specific DNA methylase